MRALVTPEGISPVILVPASSPLLHYSGRFVGHGSARRFDWPGVSILFRSSTTSASILLNETRTNRYAVLLSGPDNLTRYRRHREILTSAGRKTAWGHYGSYELFSGLSAEPRGVMVLKLTEACGARPPCDWCPSFGAAIFGGLIFDEGSDLSEAALPWREGRRLAFYGDSITVGWGAGRADRPQPRAPMRQIDPPRCLHLAAAAARPPSLIGLSEGAPAATRRR